MIGLKVKRRFWVPYLFVQGSLGRKARYYENRDDGCDCFHGERLHLIHIPDRSSRSTPPRGDLGGSLQIIQNVSYRRQILPRK